MKRVITERTVRDAAHTGRRIEIADGDVVTPAARDLARDLGVAISKVLSSPGEIGRAHV